MGTKHLSSIELPFEVTKGIYRKGIAITKYNQVERGIYFINEGIVEIVIKSYNTEKVIDFFFKNQLLSAYSSFLTQSPSDVQINTLTEVEIEVISFESLQDAYQKSFEANKFGRICTELGYIRRTTREKHLLTKTAEEKYFEMYNEGNNFVNSIPVNKIAGYLGIHPESLSRIRKKLNQTG